MTKQAWFDTVHPLSNGASDKAETKSGSLKSRFRCRQLHRPARKYQWIRTMLNRSQIIGHQLIAALEAMQSQANSLRTNMIGSRLQAPALFGTVRQNNLHRRWT